MSTLPRLVIAGTHSGVGKTTLTAGLARLLRGRGLRVQTFKCGPDYLDPTFHARASGRPCHQLDTVMMGRDAVCATFEAATHDADVALVEGVMGLYDGRDPTHEAGSTAELAKLLGAPVLLVFDASGMSRSAAALVDGYRRYDPQLPLLGVLANRTGSARHGELLRRALPADLPFFAVTRAPELALPRRHLGLVAAADDAEPTLAALADKLDRELDMAQLLGALGECGPRGLPSPTRTRPASRVRIGIAQDDAFSFYYPFNLEALRDAGAELVPFSPIADRALPDVDALYLGGGYPELHAEALARNHSMLGDVRAFAARGAPVYAECGGLIYLCRGLCSSPGAPPQALVGLIDALAVLHGTRRALGYRELVTVRDTFLAPAGTQLYGHEFRYSELSACAPFTPAYSMAPDARSEGYGAGNVLASYVHLHWGRTPGVATRFVEAAAAHRAQQHGAR